MNIKAKVTKRVQEAEYEPWGVEVEVEKSVSDDLDDDALWEELSALEAYVEEFVDAVVDGRLAEEYGVGNED